MKLCKSNRYGVEIVTGESITIVGERLDFQNLLKRASAGILDLNAFSVPRTADLKGGFMTFDEMEKATSDLLNRPDSVMDNQFGTSVEEATAEFVKHRNTAIRERKPKQDPPKTDPPKQDPPKNDPPKQDPPKS